MIVLIDSLRTASAVIAYTKFSSRLIGKYKTEHLGSNSTFMSILNLSGTSFKNELIFVKNEFLLYNELNIILSAVKLKRNYHSCLASILIILE